MGFAISQFRLSQIQRPSQNYHNKEEHHENNKNLFLQKIKKLLVILQLMCKRSKNRSRKENLNYIMDHSFSESGLNPSLKMSRIYFVPGTHTQIN